MGGMHHATHFICCIQLSQIEGFFCGRTGCPRVTATKSACLMRAPRVLLLHVKRALAPGRKSSVVLSFDLTLDVAPWLMRPTAAAATGARSAASGGAGGAGVAPGPSSSSAYLLRAVVEHRGGAMGGHYVTYRRVPAPLVPPSDATEAAAAAPRPLWALASDASVSPVSAEDMLESAEAYLLVYELLQGEGGGGGVVAGSATLLRADVPEHRRWLRQSPEELLRSQRGGEDADRAVFCFPAE